MSAQHRLVDLSHPIEAGMITACHDVSDGGTLVAVAEMAMASTCWAIGVVPSGSASRIQASALVPISRLTRSWMSICVVR